MQIIPFVNSEYFKAGQILDATIYNNNVTDCIIVFGEEGGTTVLFQESIYWYSQNIHSGED